MADENNSSVFNGRWFRVFKEPPWEARVMAHKCYVYHGNCNTETVFEVSADPKSCGKCLESMPVGMNVAIILLGEYM